MGNRPDNRARGNRLRRLPPAAAPEPAPAPAPKAEVAAPAKAPEPEKTAPGARQGRRARAPAPAEGDEVQVLRGAAAAVVKNMSASLEVPTATSVRAIPAKLMIDNRIVINNHLKRTRGGKISFTHLIGYAMVQAVKKFPNMNRHFAEVDGKPNAVTPDHTQPRARDRPAGQGRQPSARGRRHQGLRDNALRPVHRRLRGHRAACPRRQADRRGLLRA